MMTRRQTLLRLFGLAAATLLAPFRPGRSTASVPPPAVGSDPWGTPWVAVIAGRRVVFWRDADGRWRAADFDDIVLPPAGAVRLVPSEGYDSLSEALDAARSASVA
jgi:hypothetical protein